MDHNVVRGWLRSVLGPYALADRVYSHVDTLLLAFSSLAPKTEVYSESSQHYLLLRFTLALLLQSMASSPSPSLQ